jgi:hypothetical protein
LGANFTGVKINRFNYYMSFFHIMQKTPNENSSQKKRLSDFASEPF